MCKAWVAVTLLLVGGCSGKRDDEQKRSPIVADPPVDSDVKPECVDQGSVVSFDPARLRACFDSNDDDSADRCVTWRRDGKVQSIDTMFDVEDIDAADPPEPRVEWRSDEENNDDERITLDGGSIEICPYDRACMRIVPKLDDGDVHQVLTDPDYKRGVFVITNGDANQGTLEMWDLAAGKLRTRAKLKRMLADEAYDLAAHLGAGVVIVFASDSEGRAFGTSFGLDGSYRGEVAQGSRTLDVAKTFRHGNVLGTVDVGPVDEDKPYVVYMHDLKTGGALGKHTIKRDDAASDLELHVLPNHFVAATQWGEQLRIDMIDLGTRTNRILFAPGC